MPKFKFIIAINTIALVALMICYAMQVVAINEYGYQINNGRAKITELKESLREMENVYAASSSLAGLWPMIENLDLEEVKEITYININENTFAAIR